MRILVLGAGAVGGYFGGRLQESGADVTFLVRPARAVALRAQGLVLKSPDGAATLTPKLLTAGDAAEPFDLLLLSCKAYDLEAAIEAIAPYMRERTTLLPLLNGMAHFPILQNRFGQPAILGGLCQISATLGPAGEIRHMDIPPRLIFGEWSGGISQRVEAIAAILAKAKFKSVASAEILQDIWEKFYLLATLAGMTCLMRGSVGEIHRAADGAALLAEFLEETLAVATAHGHAPRPPHLESTRARMADAGSRIAASMLRDIERGGPTEGAHILGDLLTRARAKGVATPLLRVAAAHLAVYDAKRAAASA